MRRRMKNSDKNGKYCRIKTVLRILKIEQWLNERTYMKDPEIPAGYESILRKVRSSSQEQKMASQ